MPSMICPTCDAQNDDAVYCCFRCGRDMQRTHHRRHTGGSHRNREEKQRRHGKPLLPGIVAAVTVAGLLAIVVGVQDTGQRQPSPPPRAGETRRINALVEARVTEIASKFVCSCRSCGQESLEQCTCYRAVEERHFTRGRLERGLMPAEIIDLVSTSYEGKKS